MKVNVDNTITLSASQFGALVGGYIVSKVIVQGERALVDQQAADLGKAANMTNSLPTAAEIADPNLFKLL